MFFDSSLPPDPEDPGAWDDEGALATARSAAAFDAPDAMDLLLEVSDMMTMQAAERLVRIDVARREALADAVHHGRALTDVVDRSVRLEIAAALRITENGAAALMAQADALVHRYPTVLGSFRRARMSERHAEILVSAVDSVEPELREGIVPVAVRLAETQPVGSFRRALTRLIETTRAVTLERRHEEAQQRRRVVVEKADEGMGWLHLYAPMVELHAIHSRATAMAKTLGAQEGDSRSLDQRRADVVCDLLIEGDALAPPSAARGIRPTVVVTVPALILLKDHLESGDEPATLEGIGSIPLSRARALRGRAGVDARPHPS